MNTNLDMLINRVVDGVAARADWDALEAMGASDPGVWRELAQAQRAEQLLRTAAGRAVAVAEHVALPPGGVVHAEHRLKFRLRRVSSWGGWAAAALVTFAFLGRGQVASPGVQPAGLGPSFASSDQAYKQYLEQGKKEGRVIAEIPDRVLMDASQTQDGKAFDVIFVRQIMERGRVDSLSQLSHDEAGRPVLAPVRVIVAGGRM
jgi:hypothetical protein